MLVVSVIRQMSSAMAGASSRPCKSRAALATRPRQETHEPPNMHVQLTDRPGLPKVGIEGRAAPTVRTFTGSAARSLRTLGSPPDAWSLG